MPEETTLKNVSKDQVGTLVQQVVDTGAEKVKCVKQPNGEWTIKAS